MDYSNARPRKAVSVTRGFLFCVLFSAAYPAMAGSASLDASYGISGVQSFHFDDVTYNYVPEVTSDGGIMLAVPAKTYDGSGRSAMRMLKLNQNGELDTSWQNGGVVENPSCLLDLPLPGGKGLNFSPRVDFSSSHELKVTVTGCDSAAAVDGTFGDQGKVTSAVPLAFSPSVPVQNSVGVYYNVGPMTDEGALLFIQDYYTDVNGTLKMVTIAAKMNADGTLNTQFGNNGVIILHDGLVSDYAYGTTVQVESSGAFYIAGVDADDVQWTNMKNYLYHFDANGQPDTAFGSNGKLSLDFVPDGESVHSVVRMPGGELAVESSSMIAMLNSDGTLSRGFASNGILDFSAIDSAILLQEMSLTADEKLMFAGMRQHSSDAGSDAILGEVSADGTFPADYGSTHFLTFAGERFHQSAVTLLPLAGDNSLLFFVSYSDNNRDANTREDADIARIAHDTVDILPDPLTFSAVHTTDENSLITSAPTTVSGLSDGVRVPLEAENGEVSVNGGSWVAAGERIWVKNGDGIAVRRDSGAVGNTVSVHVTLGGRYPYYSRQFLVGDRSSSDFHVTTDKPDSGSGGASSSSSGGGGALGMLLLGGLLGLTAFRRRSVSR